MDNKEINSKYMNLDKSIIEFDWSIIVSAIAGAGVYFMNKSIEEEKAFSPTMNDLELREHVAFLLLSMKQNLLTDDPMTIRVNLIKSYQIADEFISTTKVFKEHQQLLAMAKEQEDANKAKEKSQSETSKSSENKEADTKENIETEQKIDK